MRRIYLVSSGDEVRYCIYAIESLGGNNMNKMNNIFKSKKSKIIGSTIISILIIGIGTMIYLNNKKEYPVIIFKDNILLEYGQKSFSDEETVEELDGNNSIEVLDPEDIIVKDKSKYDEISFNKISNGNTPMTLEFRFVDTSEIGKHEGTLFARLGNELKEFKFDYDVVDTNDPIIENVNDQEIIEGEDFIHDFKAHDIIDGELEVTIEGEYDVTTPGTYDLKAVASDKNNNKTAVDFKLIVTEKEVAVVEELNTTLPNTGSNSETSTNKGTNSNTGSNNSGNSSSGTKPVTPTKPVEPTKPVKPVEPTKPTEPNKGNGDWLEYKDYGSYEGCNAVLDEVSRSKVREWKQSMCDKDGTLVYKKR